MQTILILSQKQVLKNRCINKFADGWMFFLCKGVFLKKWTDGQENDKIIIERINYAAVH